LRRTSRREKTKVKAKVEAKTRTTIKYLFIGFFGLFAFIEFMEFIAFIAFVELLRYLCLLSWRVEFKYLIKLESCRETLSVAP